MIVTIKITLKKIQLKKVKKWVFKIIKKLSLILIREIMF